VSSNVQDVKRECDDLVVTFKNGSRYRYHGVPDDVYVEYQKAESKGTFISRNLRGRFRTQKLDEDA
jgi:hypothetical protein